MASLSAVSCKAMHAGYIFIPLNINTAVQQIRHNVTCVSVMVEIPPLQTHRERMHFGQKLICLKWTLFHNSRHDIMRQPVASVWVLNTEISEC